MEVILMILGGVGCVVMMVAGMWLLPRLARRSRLVRSVVARLRSRTPTIDRIISWVEAEEPDLRRATAPDGTVTLVFSDIENSTSLNERLGDERWLEVLTDHNAIVRAHVDEHDGHEVKAQGDGFMLAFSRPRRAVKCAVDIQRALTRRAANGELPIRVRIGIHAGEVIRKRDDFYGRNVVLAARLADHAEGGEILASSAVRELAGTGGDIAFRDAGEVELKGLSDPQAAFRVAWAPSDGPSHSAYETLRPQGVSAR